MEYKKRTSYIDNLSGSVSSMYVADRYWTKTDQFSRTGNDDAGISWAFSFIMVL